MCEVDAGARREELCDIVTLVLMSEYSLSQSPLGMSADILKNTHIPAYVRVYSHM